MGGRGSSSRIGGGGGLGLGGGGGGLPNMQGAGAPVPPIVPGQPVPAITIQQLQSMSDQEFVTYINGLKSTPIDQLTYYNHDWDTQRLIANMPEMNKAPEVVSPQAFASLPGETIYRTVNAAGGESAIDICGRTMTSDVTTIGAGVFGDGFYFANNKSVSQSGYGLYKGNLKLTATMQAKLNSNAKVITSGQLNNMLANESPAVQSAVRQMRSGGQWGGGGSGKMAYALRKGYNVIKRESDSVYDVIDRNAATWSGEIIPMK